MTRILIFFGFICISNLTALADEGMWTFDNFPSAEVQNLYGVKIDEPWLNRVRLATVRLSNCTASFVSPNGLILTNHHCIANCIAENSSKDKNLLEDGFIAATYQKEIRCSTQIADTLIEIENISNKISKATSSLSNNIANEIRKKTLTNLEKLCEKKLISNLKTTAISCQSVNLYKGGGYYLYKYRRYTDIRLVFAPEANIAAFGGDPDNFQFPRWCLDMGLLRAYENGVPVKIKDSLHINWKGPSAGEFVLVSGHPGSTNRLLSTSQLDYLRTVDLPRELLLTSELRGRFLQFGKTSIEAQRIVLDTLNNLENQLKVKRKKQDALLDPVIVSQKIRDENALKQYVAQTPALLDIGNPWTEIEKITELQRNISNELYFLENAAGFDSHLFKIARTLVRGTMEREKPNADRLREYTDNEIPRIEQKLAADTPVYLELENLTLSFSLERMREWLGPDHLTVRDLFAKDSADTLANSLLSKSQLSDPRVRLALWKGGSPHLRASTDPMIQFAFKIEPKARALRKRYEDEIEGPMRSAEEKIAKARFSFYGTNIYPDATFTLRLNFGTVQGWVEKGQVLKPFTNLSTAFARSTGQTPFKMPESWVKVKNQLDSDTLFNISSNNDIVGGNSGSPLLNAQGEIVGLMFDGNIHSISGAYFFDTTKNRSTSVHPAIMLEALKKVYLTSNILTELNYR